MLDGYVPSLIIFITTAVLFFLRWFMFTRTDRRVPRVADVSIALFVIVCAGALELAMGRVATCTCGYIKFWHGVVFSSENSQHISDWYTFSHIIHGFGLFFLLRFARKRLSLGTQFILATSLEAAWEVLENTAMVINRYRAVTISLDYFGDSVLNSVMDMLAMVLGFYIASRAPLWVTIALTVLMEGVVVYYIRDNLTLNIIMLAYPLKAIRVWQAGG